MMRLVINSFFLILICVSFSFAQGELPVNFYAGRANLTLPITTVSSHEISDDVSLQYNPTGLQLAQTSGNVGMGFSLVAGGSITRQVHGLPDEVSDSRLRQGWFNKISGVTVATDVGNFANASDTLAGTADAGEATDYTKINSYSYLYDTEPDVFSYNFGSYSGKFVFDNGTVPSVRLIPFSNIKVDVINFDNGSPMTFVITTNDGVKYTFDQTLSETRTTTPIGASIDFLQRDYNLYLSGVYYIFEWKLSKIQSPLGATINYAYTADNDLHSTDTVKVSVRNNSGVGVTVENIYYDARTTNASHLNGITSSTGRIVSFNNVGSGLISSININDVNAPSFQKNFTFTYLTSTVASYNRYFLYKLTESTACVTKPPYVFSYVSGVVNDANLTIATGLPGPYSKSVDFWGYYNGKANTSLFPSLYYYPSLTHAQQIRLYPIPNSSPPYSVIDADRTPDSTLVQIGSLNKVQFPDGGSTVIQYQTNQYYDPQAPTVPFYIGGGLRIFRVTYFDGVNSGSNIVKLFFYKDSLGRCSGRLMSTPVFAIPMMQYKDPSSGTVVNKSGDWSFLFARTTSDVSAQEVTEGSPVGYSEVRVSKPTHEYVRYQYLMPATYGAYTGPSWTATLDKFARSSSSSGILGPVTSGGGWTYPYTQNPNEDQERGLAYKVREYNSAGVLVRFTYNYYQYLYKNNAGPVNVFGLRYDAATYGSSTFFFGKYSWQTDVSKVLQKVKVFTYDENAVSKNQASLTEYIYGSTFHKLLTQTRLTTSDQVAYSTHMKYPLDYGTIPSAADTTSQMIANLQNNFRNGSPIETYTSMLRNGVDSVTGGTLLRYNNFGTSNIFIKKRYSLSLLSPVPLSSFQVSNVNTSTNSFTIDPHYEIAQTNLTYDTYGNLQSTVGPDRQISSIGYSSNLYPTVSVKNAAANQFAFSDFENSTGMEFTVASGFTQYVGTGRTGANAFYPGAKITKTISKAAVNNYTLSFWVNSTSSLTFSVNLKDASGNVITGYPLTVTVPSSGGTLFSYIRKTIPVTNVASASMFTIELQAISVASSPTGGSSPGLLPLIDDVSFYPESATLSSETYAIPYGVTSTTSGSQTNYVVYDNMGRLKYAMDTYKNIREKDSYRYQSDVAPVLSAAVSMPSPVTEGADTFVASGNPCIDGVSYS